MGGQLGPPKKKLCGALGLQPPPNGCQLGRPKLSVLASNLGPILGRSWRRLDAQERFFEVQLGGGPLSSITSHLGASWVVLGAATNSEPPRRRRGAAKIPPGVVPGTPPKSDLKKIALGRPGASKTLPRWVPSWTQKIQFWRLKLASIWKGSWSPRAPQSNFFGGPSCPPLGTPPQKKKWPPGKESILKSDYFFWWGAVLEGQLGRPKKKLCGALGLQPPPQMDANLGVQN